MDDVAELMAAGMSGQSAERDCRIRTAVEIMGHKMEFLGLTKEVRMSDTLLQRFWPWILQTLLASTIWVWWEVFAEWILRWGEFHSPFGSDGFQVFQAAVLVVLGFGCGAAISRLYPTACRTGTWVWTLPVSVFAITILWALYISHGNLGRIWTNYFYWYKPGAGVGPLGRELMSYPALSSVSYSLGMLICSGSRSVRNEVQ